jgi:type IV fimbrial biogenesis protein FimT
MPAMKYRRGFTIIELMIGITLVAILFGLAVPSFREFTRGNRVTAAQNDLVTSLNLARSEALRRNRAVSVCASSDGATCASASDWELGWIAFTDRGTAGTLDSDDQLLQFWPGPGGGDGVEINSGGSAFVRYGSTGMVDATATVELAWTGCSGPKKRRVTVMASGSIVGQKVEC